MKTFLALMLALVSTLFVMSCIRGQMNMEPAIKILHTLEIQAFNMIRNPSFETNDGVNVDFWSPYGNGYKIAPGQGREGGTAVICTNETSDLGSGISQTIYLNQATPKPIMIKGWSKAKSVSGGKSSGYSIYVDVIYQDNTPLWGQTGNFNTGTHDWEQVEFAIIPTKPVKQVTIYGLFRDHIGEVLFDDFLLYTSDEELLVFDTVPIEPPKAFERKSFKTETFVSGNLSIGYDHRSASICSLSLDGEDISAKGIMSGFLVRDVSQDSDFYTFTDGNCEKLRLSLETKIYPKGDSLVFEGRVGDWTGLDRAITLIFALPIDAINWLWHDDMRSCRTIERGMEYSNCVNINTGTSGMLSLYPMGCISNSEHGIAIAIDMGMPAQYRIAYNSATKHFFIAYDFGISPDTDNFPSSAPFRFVLYGFDPGWGFRSALKKLYDIFPSYFVCRSKDQGIWMPFTDVSTVEGWEDFGFKYHEGINNIEFDDRAGILSFRYTEPSTWWMRMDPTIPRTEENVMKLLSEHARSHDPNMRRRAEAVIVSGSFDEQGRYQYLVRNEPWCNGVVFSTNPNPYIPGNSEARVNWNEDVKERLYGDKAKGVQDGEYLDSLEGYVTADENFRREHFHYVTIPLTFSISSKKPVIHKAFSVHEFSKWLSEDVHNMGKLMFANAVPHRFSFLCQFFDVMGSEVNWVGRDGSWHPGPDSWLNLCRSMCYHKPYLLLMNTRFERFTPELVEKYFQRCLFYGIFPSMFSHNASEDPYWRSPEFYNRDRDLFKRYIPIIKKVAESGWEPITYARTDNENVYVERFGPNEHGEVFFTLLNNSTHSQDVSLTVMNVPLQIRENQEVKDIISNDIINASRSDDNLVLKLKMSPEQVIVISLKSGVRSNIK